MSTASHPPRVVVADDSALMRRIVGSVLRRGGVEVVGSAADGDEALAMCERERPDAMTLDLTMPGLGGIDVLRALRQPGRRTLPVVVVSAFSPAHGARAVDALAEGAFELVQKPNGAEGEVDAFEQNLLAKVRAAIELRRRDAAVADVAQSPPPAPRGPRPATLRVAGAARPQDGPRVAVRRGLSRVLLIATSTGGPRALAELLPALPAPLGVGTLIVQHMPAGFTASLAARLDRASRLDVREAAGGERLDPRVALVAPGGRHLRLSDDGLIELSDEAPLGGLRPRADLLIADAARRFRERLTLVVLTGMGNDGLRGAEEVRRHGGRILVEAEESCTVYGMPRAIVDAHLADVVLPLDRLPEAIAAEVSG
jgi:two-component system, chemotaxis family, protein-glutamate methylesterase/glutaminase